MASKQLAVNVTVGGETYPAGSTPPAEVADLIDNPKAWGQEPDAEVADEPESKDTPEAPVKKAPAKRAAAKK